MNERLFYLYRFTGDLVPVYPVYVLLFRLKGLSITQISVLLAIWCLPGILLEVPTGVLADKWNRKFMLIIGRLFKAACYSLWFFADGATMFAIGFILWGIGGAFCSGTEEAILFDSLKQKGREKQFDRILGRSVLYSGIGVAVSGVTGGFLATISLKLVLVLSVLTMFISAGIALWFPEVNLYRQDYGGVFKTSFKHYFATLKEGLNHCLGDCRLLVLILFSTMVICTAGVLDEYDQLIVSGFGLGFSFIGIWGSLRYLMEALGARVAFKIRYFLSLVKMKERFRVIVTVSSLAGILLGLTGYFNSLALLPVYGVFYFLMAAAKVLFTDAVQQTITGQGRATIYSLTALLENLSGIGLYALFACATAHSGIQTAIIVFALYVIGCGVIFTSINHGGKQAPLKSNQANRV